MYIPGNVVQGFRVRIIYFSTVECQKDAGGSQGHSLAIAKTWVIQGKQKN